MKTPPYNPHSVPGTCTRTSAQTSTRASWSLCLIACWFATLPMQSRAAEDVIQIASFEQWPAVSQLIAYKNRLWFVNSQPFENTNTADIYSYLPGANASVRYERSLFSQDAGSPVVYEDLLYWPFEDPRRSASAGEYAVTDGSDWRWQVMQDGQAMHVHAMSVCDDKLVAVTGSWTGQFLAQEDDKRWQLQYDYPAGSASFSRLVSVGQYKNRCIVSAFANGKKEAKLFAVGASGNTALTGWPVSDRVDGMTVHKDDLFAFADTGNQRSFLRYDGAKTHTITLPDFHRPLSMHSNGTKLWLVTSYSKGEQNNRGGLWLYNGNDGFKPLANIEHRPVSIASFEGKVYIGTYNKSGGSLWSYTDNTADVVQPSPAYDIVLPKKNSSAQLDQSLIDTIVDELSKIISDPANIEDSARGLRKAFAHHSDLYLPEFGAAITHLLTRPMQDKQVSMFSGVSVSQRDLVSWYLLSTLAINGHGKIDPAWITSTSASFETISENTSGKIFEPAIAAIVAAGWINQSDNETLSALMQRLNNEADPLWIKSDVIGALTALTKKPFAYDIEKWNQWWREQI